LNATIWLKAFEIKLKGGFGFLKMEDEKIIELYFYRSEDAIPETEEKFGKLCVQIAKNILGNEEDAKECLNDVLLALWNTIPPKRPENFSAYIGKISRNIALNNFRKKNAGKRGGNETFSVLDEISEFVSGGETPEEKIEETELISEINSFLASIPAEKRKIFVARYWFFESAEEISKRTGKSRIFIRNTLNRTRNQLKKHLKERGFEL